MAYRYHRDSGVRGSGIIAVAMVTGPLGLFRTLGGFTERWKKATEHISSYIHKASNVLNTICQCSAHMKVQLTESTDSHTECFRVVTMHVPLNGHEIKMENI